MLTWFLRRYLIRRLSAIKIIERNMLIFVFTIIHACPFLSHRFVLQTIATTYLTTLFNVSILRSVLYLISLRDNTSSFYQHTSLFLTTILNTHSRHDAPYSLGHATPLPSPPAKGKLPYGPLPRLILLQCPPGIVRSTSGHCQGDRRGLHVVYCGTASHRPGQSKG